MLHLDDWRDAIYAQIVKKVGQRQYWEDWAKDIAQIADRHKARILAALALADKKAAFTTFLGELRASINPGVSESDAIDMLAQHIVTKPVFDALFKDYAFAEHNPVSRAMQRMLDVLEDQSLESEAKTLRSFYDSVRVRAEGIDNHEGRQRVIIELYDKFFKTALPKTADALGIVYTPVEVVDFILRATDQALDRHFGTRLSDEGVHLLDPFTGTGTFVVRLLQSGLIQPGDLLRKYRHELHANEIVLLAYYIAAVNIEAAFADTHGPHEYEPFEGIVLTDTFQLAERHTDRLFGALEGNNERVRKQQAQDIRVIVGNPPYSVGQDSQNDDNQNVKYQALDHRIQTTYAARSTATNKNSLYDSYIRAIRWASDRIKDEGVVAYVSNGGYIDGNTADGLRLSLAEEFDAIYCYNLRGNQRTAGELSRKEGGKVFGSGSRSTVAVLILVKGGASATAGGGCRLHYRDIGDYLSRADKLRILAGQDLDTVEWQRITPSPEGDWINQRDERYATFQFIGGKDKALRDQTVFALYSNGLNSGRDAWIYNFSDEKVRTNMESVIDFYNEQADGFKQHCKSTGVVAPTAKDAEQWIDTDPRKISWNRADKTRIARGTRYAFKSGALRTSLYRPFTKAWSYFDKPLIHETAQLPSCFPAPALPNFGFYNVGSGSAVPFSVLMTDIIPDVHVTGAGSGGYFFPRHTYRALSAGDDLFAAAESQGDDDGTGYERVDNITDAALRDYRETYQDDSITKDDVFSYAYGLLHSPSYRTQFAADLKKSLPRIPKVRDFRGFADAGRELADLHVGYESVAPYGGIVEQVTGSVGTPPAELFRVTKMKIPKKRARRTAPRSSTTAASRSPTSRRRRTATSSAPVPRSSGSSTATR